MDITGIDCFGNYELELLAKQMVTTRQETAKASNECGRQQEMGI
jgi:hypothetical protein